MQGKYFYLTPGICPSLSTMKSILESAGGKLLTKQPSYRKIMEHNQNKVLKVAATLSCLYALINVHRGGRFLCDNMAETWEEYSLYFHVFSFSSTKIKQTDIYIFDTSLVLQFFSIN